MRDAADQIRDEVAMSLSCPRCQAKPGQRCSRTVRLDRVPVRVNEVCEHRRLKAEWVIQNGTGN